MISYYAFKELEKEDANRIGDIHAILEEAEEFEKLIKSNWCINSKDGSAVVWKNRGMGATEYLTYDGVWHKDISGEGKYVTVDCNAATIFEYLKAEYLLKNYCACAIEDGEVVDKAEICSYFREFVKNAQEKHGGVSE